MVFYTFAPFILLLKLCEEIIGQNPIVLIFWGVKCNDIKLLLVNNLPFVFLDLCQLHILANDIRDTCGSFLTCAAVLYTVAFMLE